MTGQPNHITLVGCGNMGGAMLKGWLAAKIDARFLVIDPHDHSAKYPDARNVTFTETPDDRVKNSDTIILAVKPQLMDAACAAIKSYISPNALIISVAAGRAIASFENTFGASQPIVRSMPNLPAAIGKGMTAAIGNKNVTADQKSRADLLLRAAGDVAWINDEELMHAVTATSGSGPGYIFYMIEALANAAEKTGLDKDLAIHLARQTIIGSAALADANPDITAETLRKNVTSPNGTTEAGLKILMDGKMQEIFDKALAAAQKRSRELG